jgi:Ca2+-binding EF-hand superfamily protein
VGVSGTDASDMVQSVIKEIDKNGDGQISFEEFLAAMAAPGSKLRPLSAKLGKK